MGSNQRGHQTNGVRLSLLWFFAKTHNKKSLTPLHRKAQLRKPDPAAQFFAPRYDVIESDKMLIKQDKWSGNSWRFEGNKWEAITDTTRDWKPVDAVLMKALNFTAKGETKGSDGQMAALKKKYPLLEEISNEDIMERIKYIYARKIMVDLYFSNVNVK